MFEFETDYGTLGAIRVEVAAAPRWRRPWPGYWSRWWVEASYRRPGEGFWNHDWEKDTGAFTLRRAMWKATALEEELVAERMGNSRRHAVDSAGS